MSIEPRAIPHMRAASYLLPDPGGSVVRDLLDEVERLQSQLNERLAPDPRVAVLESICEFLARPITIPTYLSARGREYYILDVTEYRSQILKLIAAQRGDV